MFKKLREDIHGAMTSKALMSLLITIVVSLALFAVLAEIVGGYTEKDDTTGAPVLSYMTNTTCTLLDLVPFLVVIGILFAAVVVAIPRDE